MIRSVEMTLVQLVERNDVARMVITELGEAGLVHFIDMNGDTPYYKRAFSSDLKRCDEMARRLTYVTGQVEAAKIAITPHVEGSLLPSIVHLEASLRSAHTDVREAREQEAQVARAHNALKEHLHVLSLGGAVFDGDTPSQLLTPSQPHLSRGSSSLSAPLLGSAFPTGAGSAGAQETLLHVQAGAVNRALAPALVRALHRVTRGNCVVHDVPIEGALLGVPQVRERGGWPPCTLLPVVERADELAAATSDAYSGRGSWRARYGRGARARAAHSLLHAAHRPRCRTRARRCRWRRILLWSSTAAA